LHDELVSMSSGVKRYSLKQAWRWLQPAEQTPSDKMPGYVAMLGAGIDNT